MRGGDAWSLDGTSRGAGRGWGYGRLDGAVADDSGRWAVVHERTGTAALLVHDGEIVRQLHRAPYHADSYLYPACLFRHAGRLLLAHCPESYARIELDDAATGERLTRSATRVETDFFHSRLAVSPSGGMLLSAGWVWHPFDAVVWFDVAAALAHPPLLDVLDGAPHGRDVCLAEHSSAAWIDDDRVVIGSSAEPEELEDAAAVDAEAPGPRLHPRGLAVYRRSARAWERGVDLGDPPGEMMPVGADHVVTLFRHPRLVSLATGEVVHAWPDVDSGAAASSIVGDRPLPAIALDPARARFAVAGPAGIDVVAIDA